MKTFKIGRNQDNDIVINDDTRTVSGYHAKLTVYDDGDFSLIDKSTNGTFINGVKMTKGLEVSFQKDDEVYLKIRINKIAYRGNLTDKLRIHLCSKSYILLGGCK